MKVLDVIANIKLRASERVGTTFNIFDAVCAEIQINTSPSTLYVRPQLQVRRCFVKIYFQSLLYLEVLPI